MIEQFINELAQRVHQTAISKGWYEDQYALCSCAERYGSAEMLKRIRQLFISEKLLLVHSELSEGVEYQRANDANDDKLTQFLGIEVELADAVIRILDLAAMNGYRLGEALQAKMTYNESRPHKHGGKKF